MSILSTREDGYGYFYGFREGDHRQINVRLEFRHPPSSNGKYLWFAYVGGEFIPGGHKSKDAAEAAAIAWAEANPVEGD